MKAVLLSIKPKYCELIASGKKTIEVRKTKPKIDTPFKCYIYCTKTDKKGQPLLVDCGGRMGFGDWRNAFNCDEEGKVDFYIAEGKVIGHFTCDKTEYLRYVPTKYYGQPQGTYEEIICANSCLTVEEIKEYAKGKPIYGWYISNLKIYDKPKDLNEFTSICKFKDGNCDICVFYKKAVDGCSRTIKSPQSWCYVEVEE
jgi:predicted transcriptional regulator